MRKTFVFACATLLADPAAATTVLVNTLADDGSNACPATCTLRAAIASAAAGSEIRFAPVLTASATPDAPAKVALKGNELVVDKTLSIIGPADGVLMVSGEHQSRVFHVTAGQVELANLRIANGSVLGQAGGDAGGGGLRVETSTTVSLIGCAFENNTASGGMGAPSGAGGGAYGGAIYSAGTLAIGSSSFTGNAATGGMGGMGTPSIFVPPAPPTPGGPGGPGGASVGGAIYLASGVMDAHNITVFDNTATGGSGGPGGFGPLPGPPGPGGSASSGAVEGTTGTNLSLAFATIAANLASAAVGQNAGVGGVTAPNASIRSSLLAANLRQVGGGSTSTANCSIASLSAAGANLSSDASCTGFTLTNTAVAFKPGARVGGTWNLLPLRHSAVIDAAQDCTLPGGTLLTVDQGSLPRPMDGNGDGVAQCDLGATEADYVFVDGMDG
ncbi:hypothetical protein [Dokdonella soli]|uniref:CSLREA domain-containing protein n=1 Tax=Dokdonella soli TaxID=529810 RepID=A0ABP3U8C3_9GAMM